MSPEWAAEIGNMVTCISAYCGGYAIARTAAAVRSHRQTAATVPLAIAAILIAIPTANRWFTDTEYDRLQTLLSAAAAVGLYWSGGTVTRQWTPAAGNAGYVICALATLGNVVARGDSLIKYDPNRNGLVVSPDARYEAIRACDADHSYDYVFIRPRFLGPAFLLAYPRAKVVVGCEDNGSGIGSITWRDRNTLEVHCESVTSLAVADDQFHDVRIVYVKDNPAD